jgi:hypothetical protein
MAGWNGSGIFSKTHSWVQDQLNGILIRADRHDANDTDFTNGINNCLTKDGQNTPTANLPMGSYVHTGVGNATARSHYLSMGQFQDNSGITVTTTGTANTYVASPSPALTSYTAGQGFTLLMNVTNTGASTLNVSALGAKSLVTRSDLPMMANELIAGRVYRVVYNGTNFVVMNPTEKPQIIMGAHSTAYANEIPLNGGTLAKTSGADTNGNQYALHYLYLWDNYADAQAPVNGGRGASAAADFAANKWITAPDYRDRVAMGISGAGSITTVGATAGASTVPSAGTNSSTGSYTLTTSDIPSHTHTFPTGGTISAPATVTVMNATDGSANGTLTTTATGGADGHVHPGSTFTGSATSVVQKSIGQYFYLRA